MRAIPADGKFIARSPAPRKERERHSAVGGMRSRCELSYVSLDTPTLYVVDCPGEDGGWCDEFSALTIRFHKWSSSCLSAGTNI